MEYTYNIRFIDEKTRWIFLSDNEGLYQELPDSFIHMVRTAADNLGGKIRSVGNMQYVIESEPLQLVFQWDELFGIVIIYPDAFSLSSVLKALLDYGILTQISFTADQIKNTANTPGVKEEA